MQPARVAPTIVHLLIRWSAGLLLSCANTFAAELPDRLIYSLAELQNLAATNHQFIASFSVTGLVCAAEAESRLVALQDDSATVLLELPQLDPGVRPGDWLALEGNQVALTRSAAGILVGTAPVAEVDNVHPPLSRSGRVFLAAGRQPIRVEWFNALGGARLELQYAGPGGGCERIPDAALCCRAPEKSAVEDFQPGLNYVAYAGSNWTALPDFRKLNPVTTGVAANFDVEVRPRPQHAALVFHGWLQISNAGVYTFHLRSDDGGRLFVGDAATQCVSTRLERAATLPAPQSLAQALAGRSDRKWVSLEGKITFASRRGEQLELEIMDRDQPVSVLIASGAGRVPTDLAHQRVQVTGICQLPPEARAPRIIVPGVEQLKILGRPASLNRAETLTTAAQVRELQPGEARQQLRSRVRGVVTMATYWSCVLQDLTGGIFVRHHVDAWPQQPVAGELWEFEGVTDPGDFSPIIRATNGICLGNAVLPPPIHPTWEQLVNGSMDAELVEIQGVVVDVSAAEMTLLTRDGKVKVLEKNDYPLPAATALPMASQALPGSVVRVRGVFAAFWDAVTRQLIPGRFYLGNTMLSVDEPAPGNPFGIPTKRVTDLLLFTSHAGALTRFKVTGQVLYAQPREYYLLDGEIGFRVLTKEPVPLEEGDLVEAVGFPQLGGPSAVLLEAKARKVGRAPRPAARPISVAELSREGNDATLVQVEALLLSDVVRLDQRVLELQAGSHHFLARLRTDGNPPTLLRRGSRLQITGVYTSNRERAADSDLDGFELLLNRANDIVVLKHGPWWTTRHTMGTIAVLLTGLMASLVWVALLRRTVAQRTARLEKEINARQQIEQRRLLEQERTRVAQDLHDDLGAGLAQIGLIGALAQRPNTAPARAQDHLFVITEKSRDMIAVLDEIVWAINPKHDSATAVGSYLCDYAQDFMRPASIACRFDVAHAHVAQMLDSTRRHQLFLAFKEALTNVVKHAQATEVWIRISSAAGELSVTVEDNGQGIPEPAPTKQRNGTLNMHSRLAQIGGRCEIQPRPGGGTLVCFRLLTNPNTPA